jgi:hypothetical protein
VLSCARVLARKYNVSWIGAASCIGAAMGVLLGCGDDVAALAEGAPEPTIWAVGEAHAGALVFAEGVRIGARTITPARVEPGVAVTVRSSLTGLPDGVELWVGLRAPRAAGRQEVAGQSRQRSRWRRRPA